MGTRRYIISDASKMLKVESHVLRYWEEELEIKIPRNEMGHRYYTEENIELLRKIRDLKEQGYGLRTIKMMEKLTLIVLILIQSTLEIFLTNQRVKKIHFIKKMKKDVIMV
mgnify:CR=1 FL=1